MIGTQNKKMESVRMIGTQNLKLVSQSWL